MFKTAKIPLILSLLIYLILGLREVFTIALAGFKPQDPSFNSVFISSLVASMLACNQSLPILLVWELNQDLEKDPYRLASHLENSAVVLPALIPWSIASTLPLAAMGAGSSAIPYAFYLYLLPLVSLVGEIKNHRSSYANKSS